VSGNLTAGLRAAWVIARTFVRLGLALRQTDQQAFGTRSVKS
jgi:hypothetical protein